MRHRRVKFKRPMQILPVSHSKLSFSTLIFMKEKGAVVYIYFRAVFDQGYTYTAQYMPISHYTSKEYKTTYKTFGFTSFFSTYIVNPTVRNQPFMSSKQRRLS